MKSTDSLQLSEAALYKGIIEAVPLNIYWKNLQLEYIHCNIHTAKQLGLTQIHEIIGTNDYAYFPRDSAEKLRKNDAEVLLKNEPCLFEEKGLDIRDPSSIYLSYKLPFANDDGIVIGIAGISINITARAHEEEYIRYEKERIEMTLAGILENLPGHVYWKNRDSVYQGCNVAQAQSAGLSNPMDIVGKTDYEMPWRHEAHILRESDLTVMNMKTVITSEENSQLANSDKISVFLSKKAPLYNKKGDVVGIMGVSFDISDRKEIENALRDANKLAEAANHAKTEFLSNMRHDIRTPLSGIVGFSELLKSESTEPRIKEYADNLIASSHALLHLMDEVLEAIRVSSGDIPRLKRKFNLRETFEHIIALYRAKAEEKKLNLTLNIDRAFPNFVIGDKIRLHRIALELVGNALNFTDKGHVALNVDLIKKEHRQLIIKITIRDTGIGIPKDKQQDIYLQFKRLTPSYQGIYKGAGLGLYVVKQFVDELEGEIYVESEPNKGTVFICLIPLQEPLIDDACGINEDEDGTIEKSYLMPLSQSQELESTTLERTTISRILVVEDNFIAQVVAKSLLSSLSCRVDIATNGPAAIALYNQNTYDLIFMDIGLGEGMDGYEVTRHIRTHFDTNDTHIPIIALTAHGAEESKQRCIEAGMDAVLTKPLTQASTLDILNTFIPARHALKHTKVISARFDLPDTDEELFQINQFPLLDCDEALKNCGTQELVVDMLALMTKELPFDLKAMKTAYDNKDPNSVEKIAHRIKGGTVYVGTTRLRYACQYIERYLKTGSDELFDALYHQAINTIEETLTYINGWLKK